MLKKLYEPIQIGNVTVKNRYHVPPMVVNFCTEEGMVTEKFIKHHENKAKGGFGLITVEQSVIAREGKAHPGQPGLWSDDHIPGLTKLTDRVHEAGGKISIQINHGGRQSMTLLTGTDQLIAPSAIKDPIFPETPREISIAEIEELVELFGDAALRAKKAGFDMVTEHVHGGYLLASFLSPHSNKRTDKYGGTLYNRARFSLEALKNMKKKCGDDFPVIVRYSVEDFVEGGLAIEDAVAYAGLLEDAGADCIDVTVGNTYSYIYMVQPTAVAHGFVANLAREIKKAVSIPVAVAGRINDPLIGEAILRTGKADIISMGRGSIADPFLPNKAKEGKFEEIRGCIGCLQGCTGQVAYYKPLKCLVNPEIGQEEIAVSKTEHSKKVMVIGGGISGMQAAITASQRGHDVHLYEKASKLGGQWLLAAIPPTKTELNTFTIWQQNELEKMNVNVHLETTVTSDLIAEVNPDRIVLATGAQPIKPGIPGVDHQRVVQAFDVLGPEFETGNKVVIIGGGLVGTETADHLSGLHKQVTLIEMGDAIAKEGEVPTNHFLFKRLEEKKVEVLTSAKLTGIREMDDANSVANDSTLAIGVDIDHKDSSSLLTVTYEKNGALTDIHNVDHVILALGARPDKSLEPVLEKYMDKVLVVGDAKQSRDAVSAIREGYEVGLTL